MGRTHFKKKQMYELIFKKGKTIKKIITNELTTAKTIKQIKIANGWKYITTEILLTI